MIESIQQLARDNYTDFIDNTCNVLNGTALAEWIADELDLFVPGSVDIPDYVYDAVTDVEFELIDEGVLNF